MEAIKRKEIIYLIGFLSLILSFYLGENSSGGAYLDYKTTSTWLESFDKGFISGFEWFIKNDQIHLPFFYYIKFILLKVFPDFLVNIFYLILSSLIPLVFFKCLKLKFSDCDDKYLFLLSLIFYFSPYFRSSAVWFTGDNLASLFFLISIYYFLIFTLKKEYNFKNAFFCSLNLILASYTRQNYFFFAIIFFYYFFYHLSFYDLIKIILSSFLISFPAIIYIFYFFTYRNYSTLYGTVDFNFIFNYLVITSLYFFYFIPFIFYYFKNFKNLKLDYIKSSITIFILILIYFLFLNFYTIPILKFSGGIYYKISKFFDLRLFYFFSFLGFLLLIMTNKINLKNTLIIVILIISFPFMYIYQKYFDPLLYIVFFTLIDNNYKNILFTKKNPITILLLAYNFLFLMMSIRYYL